MIILYILLFLLTPENIYLSLQTALHIFIQIIPVIAAVVVLMGISNYILKPKVVIKHLGEDSGVKGWILAISFGILSHGSIYVWYPLLKELRERGMKTGLLAAFLYNRAVKIPLLPLMIFYFSIPFVAVLTVYTILASVVEGKILELIDDVPAVRRE
ncbi:MAG TPA: permease [Thermoplasmatales archaeon]|nr:permease [Thermoplasmatales archaeon]